MPEENVNVELSNEKETKLEEECVSADNCLVIAERWMDRFQKRLNELFNEWYNMEWFTMSQVWWYNTFYAVMRKVVVCVDLDNPSKEESNEEFVEWLMNREDNQVDNTLD